MIVVRYEIGDDERASTALVRVVADLANRDPLEIGPLYDFVDLDALDCILGHPRSRDEWSTWVSFDLDDYSISIDGSAVVVRFTPGGPG